MVAAGALGGGSAAPAVTPAKWDKEADVVVVGGGGAGCTAAISAAESGAKVIMLETKGGAVELFAAGSSGKRDCPSAG